MTCTVQKGDTLSSIAKRYGTTVDELMRINSIDNPNHLRIGQLVQIPGESNRLQRKSTSDDPWSTTLLRFVDAIGRPIVGLAVRLTMHGAEKKGKTDAQGCLSPLACADSNTQVGIYVERAKHKGGGEKFIGSYQPMAGHQTVKVQSGKQVESTQIRRHEGAPQRPPKEISNRLAGAKLETATQAGHPLTCVQCGECPTDDDLLLGPNRDFKVYVQAAARRASVLPQAVAAIMNAEAAKDRQGKWKADSKSSKSSATGMTQFLDATWVGEALRSGTYLNEKAIKEGWLTISGAGQLQFTKSDGTYVGGPGLTAKLTSRTMILSARTAADQNLQNLLDLRLQPEFAIMAAMDYAKHNLDSLAAAGYAVSPLNDTEKARVMYLCHHLGFRDAVSFIQNTIPEEDVEEDVGTRRRVRNNGAKKLLIAQVGAVVAQTKYVSTADGSWIKAHRKWLNEFIGKDIVLHAFTCPGLKQSTFKKDEDDQTLLSITEKIKL